MHNKRVWWNAPVYCTQSSIARPIQGVDRWAVLTVLQITVFIQQFNSYWGKSDLETEVFLAKIGFQTFWMVNGVETVMIEKVYIYFHTLATNWWLCKKNSEGDIYLISRRTLIGAVVLNIPTLLRVFKYKSENQFPTIPSKWRHTKTEVYAIDWSRTN